MASTLYSAREAADLLGVHVRTIHRHIREGRLEAARVGNRYRITRGDLEAFLGTPVPRATPEPPSPPRADVSCVVDLRPVEPDDAERLRTLLLGAAGSTPSDRTHLRLDVSHDPDAAHVKVVVSGGLTHVSAILALVTAFREP